MKKLGFFLGLAAMLSLGMPAFAGDVGYDVVVSNGSGSPGGAVTLNVSFATNGLAAPQGLQYGVCHTDSGLLTLDTADFGADGAGLDTTFAAVTIDGGGGGYTCGILMNVITGATLSDADDVTFGDYTIDGAATDLDVIAVSICSTLGSPLVEAAVIESGTDILPITTDGIVTIAVATDFIRGDCNDDGAVDIADGIFTLNAIFQGGPEGVCGLACDANDDGMIDSSDAIYAFNYQFLDGPPPPAPFPDCGQVEGQDPAACVESSCP